MNILKIKVVDRDYANKRMTLVYYYDAWLSGDIVETRIHEYPVGFKYWTHTSISSILQNYKNYNWTTVQKVYERLFNGQNKARFTTR